MPSYPGIGRAVLQLVFSPTRLFESLRESPRVRAPLLLIGIGQTVIFQAAFSGPYVNDMIEVLDRSKMSSMQRAEIVEKMSGGVGRLTALGPPIVHVVSPVLLAAFFALLFVIAKAALSGPAPRFRAVLSVTTHAGLIELLANSFKLPLSLAKGTFKVFTSAALVLPSDASETRFFKFLDSFDMFSLWKLWLLTLGFTIVSGRRKAEIAMLVWGSWAVYVLGKVALSGFLTPNVRVG